MKLNEKQKKLVEIYANDNDEMKLSRAELGQILTEFAKEIINAEKEVNELFVDGEQISGTISTEKEPQHINCSICEDIAKQKEGKLEKEKETPKEACENCKYFDKKEHTDFYPVTDTTERKVNYHICRRFPSGDKTEKNSWCGEFSPNEHDLDFL